MEVEFSIAYNSLDLTQLVISLISSVIIWNAYRNQTAAAIDRYHTFWPRFWAPTIDDAVLWIPTTLLPYLLVRLCDLSDSIGLLIFLGLQFFYFGYSVYFHGRYGATVGKMKTKVKVVDAKTEGPITYGQACLRDGVPMVLLLIFFVWALTSENVADGEQIGYLQYAPLILVLWFIAEIITMFTNEKRRAIHDFIAGTVIVRTNLEGENDFRQSSEANKDD